MQEDSAQVINSATRRAQQAFLQDLGVPPDQFASAIANGEGLLAKNLDPKQVHYFLSGLKRELRHLDNASDKNFPVIDKLQQVIKATEDQMASGQFVRGNRLMSATDRANISDLWGRANRATADMHDVFDTVNMQALLSTRRVRGADGRIVHELNAPSHVIGEAMFKKGDPRYLNEAMDAIGHDPSVKAALGEELMKFYRDSVFKDGVPSRSKHNIFMRQYRDHMDTLLGPDRVSDIHNLGTFAKQMDSVRKELAVMEGYLQAQFGRRVVNPTSPTVIGKEILSDRVNHIQAKNIMRKLDSLPDGELAANVRKQVLDQIYEDVLGKTDVINSKTYSKLIRNNAETLSAVFGKQYVKDLRALEALVKLVDKGKVKGAKTPVQPYFLDLLRTTWGPLSKKQRFATSIVRLNRRLQATRAAELTKDATSLRAFVKLSRMHPSDPRFLAMVNGLGLTNFIDEATMSQAERAQQQRHMEREHAAGRPR